MATGPLWWGGGGRGKEEDDLGWFQLLPELASDKKTNQCKNAYRKMNICTIFN